MIPLEIAVDLEYTKSTMYTIFTVLIDLVFFIDIIFVFNTTLDENSVEILDRKRIALVYLKSRFTIDFLSAFPVDFLNMLFIGETN